MKKSFIHLLLFILIPGTAFANLTGSGTKNDPYRGTIATGESFTISSSNPNTRYFTYITVTGGTLTINPGVVLYARTADSYITVTETGVLSAVGTAINPITFSSDNDGDGIVDGTWKNITFELSSGSSVINNSIIERGSGNSDYGLGGGILIYGDNIEVSSSTIRGCSINGDGGGIYLYPTGQNVRLQNLNLYNNSSNGNGGGLVIDGEYEAVVSNCNIYNNSAGVGAGIYISFSAGSIINSFIHDHSGQAVYLAETCNTASIRNCVVYKNASGIFFAGSGYVVNSTVVNNSSYGITTITSAISKIVNSILWGNQTQYSVANGSLELAYCGIQGGFSGGINGGGNQLLNSVNGNDAGPNFKLPASDDFHLNAWITPLVDGGISAYDGVIIPGSDIENQTRISTIDIGAYEFPYYIWTGASSTDWLASSNWVGSPSSITTAINDNKVIIPKGCPNYPTANSLILTARSFLTIEPEAGLTVIGETNIGSLCTFKLESDETGSANFISGTSVTGNFNVELFLTGGGNPYYKWHYVTIPINRTDYPKAVLTTAISNPYNLLEYLEAKATTTNKNAGWNWHDMYASTTGFNLLSNKKGYNVYLDSDQTALFIGTVLRGDVDFINSSISCGAGDANNRGWNLIGNPFTSAINADALILTARYIDRSIYFTRGNQYMSYNIQTKVGIGDGVSNIIPAMQGFFVHSSSAIGSKSVTIPLSSRTYTTNSIYKGINGFEETKAERTFPYLKLNISDDASLNDQSIIYLFEDATPGFDSDYDAYKLLAENPAHPQIYSIADTLKMGINGLPLPEAKTVIPLRLRIGVEKSYSINILNLENLSDYKVTLNHGSEVIDLKTNPNYSFTGIPGTMDNMSITIEKLVTSIPDNIVPDKENINCWYKNGSLYLKPNSQGFENNSSVLVYDLSGNVIFAKNKLALTSGMTHELSVNLNNGLYIVKVSNTIVKSSKKLVVTQ